MCCRSDSDCIRHAARGQESMCSFKQLVAEYARMQSSAACCLNTTVCSQQLRRAFLLLMAKPHLTVDSDDTEEWLCWLLGLHSPELGLEAQLWRYSGKPNRPSTQLSGDDLSGPGSGCGSQTGVTPTDFSLQKLNLVWVVSVSAPTACVK